LIESKFDSVQQLFFRDYSPVSQQTVQPKLCGELHAAVFVVKAVLFGQVHHLPALTTH